MGRSVKKGPYLDSRLAKKVQVMEQSGKKSVIKIICSKTQKTPRALNFINQFASGFQLTRQTQQSRNYNHTKRIIIQYTS